MGDFIMYDGRRQRLPKHLIWVETRTHLLDFTDAKDYSKRVGFGGIDGFHQCDIEELQLYNCKGVTSLNDISRWEDVSIQFEGNSWSVISSHIFLPQRNTS